jgi:hypothetical protein
MKARYISIAVVLAAAIAPAAAEPQKVRGDQFITMMEGNTLSGINAGGTPFNLYFLPGGTATYDDGGGTRDSGSWHLDKEGDVCVTWQNPADRQEGCFSVTVDGRKVNWEGKAGSGRATLRGGVSETMLTAKGQ